MKTLLFLLAILTVTLLLTASMFAQTQQWSADFMYMQGNELQKTIADDSGNVYITGESFQPTYPDAGYIAKYNSTGSRLWFHPYFGPFYNSSTHKRTIPYSSIIDNSGNIYIAGSSDSSNYNTVKGFLAKYTPGGDTLFTRYAGINDSLGDVEWLSMKSDAAGNIYLGGYNKKNNPSRQSYLVAKYNSSGDLQWIKNQNPVNINQIFNVSFSLLLDNSNNIYISSTLQKNSSSSSVDIYTFKLNNAGTFQWENYYDDSVGESDNLSSAVLDISGNLYIEGLSSITSPIKKEIVCYKINGITGTRTWIYTVSGTGTIDDQAYNITAGISNDIYITGALNNNSTYDDGILVKLNASTGTEIWRNILSSPGLVADIYTEVKVISSGALYVTGALNYGSASSIIQIKRFNTSGDSLSSVNFNQGSQYAFPKAIIMGRSNSLILAGDDTRSNPNGHVFIVKYSVLTGIEAVNSSVPEKYSLSQNYPNPFNPATKINFILPQDSKVSLTVFDLSGKVVGSLINDQSYTSGSHEIEFNAGNLSSGTYFYQLKAGDFTETKKMLLIK